MLTRHLRGSWLDNEFAQFIAQFIAYYFTSVISSRKLISFAPQRELIRASGSADGSESDAATTESMVVWTVDHHNHICFYHFHHFHRFHCFLISIACMHLIARMGLWQTSERAYWTRSINF
jgi:hypothetical protein